jgi:hypothetical protein
MYYIRYPGLQHISGVLLERIRSSAIVNDMLGLQTSQISPACRTTYGIKRLGRMTFRLARKRSSWRTSGAMSATFGFQH